MAKIYLADSQDYIVAENFDEATEKYIEIRGKDPETVSIFKDEAFVITASEVVGITPGILPVLAEADGATISPETEVYIKEGDKITFVATPSVGYPTFVNFTDGSGTELSTDNPFTYTAGAVAITVNANFTT